MSIEGEYRALREGCGVVDRSWAGRLEMLGADRQRFLNAYVTCDVKSLAPGAGAYGFLTSAQGRILSDLVVLAHEDRLWLEVPPGQEGPVAEHLRKYVIVDRVEIRPLADMLPITLAGPRAEEVLGISGPLPESPWHHTRMMVCGTEVALQRGGRSGRSDRTGAPSFTLWVSASIAPHLTERLVEAGAAPVSLDALEVLRTEAGIPRFGLDFGPDNFPQETGIEEAVSYTKGCYLGQEVVARIHYRGGVQKELRSLLFDGDAPPPPGRRLLQEGREAGTVGTAVRSIALGRPVGLSILHKRAAAPGTKLEVEGGETAEVLASPVLGPATR
ncbi:MAG TPA: glycine cleavage T C-terminal barrel domain-containing protein [Thermoanaerobaculia bacterium]